MPRKSQHWAHAVCLLGEVARASGQPSAAKLAWDGTRSPDEDDEVLREGMGMSLLLGGPAATLSSMARQLVDDPVVIHAALGRAMQMLRKSPSPQEPVLCTN